MNIHCRIIHICSATNQGAWWQRRDMREQKWNKELWRRGIGYLNCRTWHKNGINMRICTDLKPLETWRHIVIWIYGFNSAFFHLEVFTAPFSMFVAVVVAIACSQLLFLFSAAILFEFLIWKRFFPLALFFASSREGSKNSMELSPSNNGTHCGVGLTLWIKSAGKEVSVVLVLELKSRPWLKSVGCLSAIQCDYDWFQWFTTCRSSYPQLLCQYRQFTI